MITRRELISVNEINSHVSHLTHFSLVICVYDKADILHSRFAVISYADHAHLIMCLRGVLGPALKVLGET